FAHRGHHLGKRRHLGDAESARFPAGSRSAGGKLGGMKPLVIVLWLVFTVVILFFFVFFDLGWSTIFVILIGLLIFPFVFLLIITFCSHRLNANPRIEQIHPGKDVVPVEFWDVARDAIDDLAGSGFKL